MSKAANSPTARLLQSSRLFSLPRSLPPPDLSGGTSTSLYRSSETATTPYPTHQAIATPASSLHRGDWGLKRSLPGKKLRGTKPTVRIRAQDTWEHVTSFESAGDHVRTLEKWNEMGVPMMKKSEGAFKGPGMLRAPKTPISVYDEGQDLTDKAKESENTRRWKYDGPWLAGMQEGEFQNWLLHQVGSRRGEWEQFLREEWAAEKLIGVQKLARDEGRTLTAEEVELNRKIHWLSDTELREHQKDLRDTNASEGFSSKLTKRLIKFLDLPAGLQDEKPSKHDEIISVAGLSNDRGPPSTHPGAGLSHLRTNAIMENHPIHGPQAMRTPVQARVIQHSVINGLVKEQRAKLGVGGVVADDSMSATFRSEDKSRYNQGTNDGTQHRDPTIVGGSKVWVRPDGAWVDENGMVRLNLSRADHESIAVRTGEGIEEIHEMKGQDDRGARGAGANGLSFGGLRANHGASLPNMRKLAEARQALRQQGGPERAAAGARQRSQVEGFDKDLEEKGRASGPEGVAELLKSGSL